MAIAIDEITGLVLAGGRGSRMGGVDKGLQNHLGMPLAMHALLRLGPQVGALMINANRNLGAYDSMGVPVWPDAQLDYPGPLAGFLAGLEHCETPYLVTVPCDTPNFPADLVARLAAALVAEDAEIAIAATRVDGQLGGQLDGQSDGQSDGQLQPQPVFCLMHAGLIESLVAFTHGGQRKIDKWTGQHRCAVVVFDEAGAFFNANTPGELQQLQPR